MSFLGSLRTWLLFNNKIIPQKYNLPKQVNLFLHHQFSSDDSVRSSPGFDQPLLQLWLQQTSADTRN